jgi:phage shock protein PspC (stress-responsive transcriptional regulator)
MKKALQITIAGTLFTIEEDAYQKLDAYLQSIKKYFSSYPDNEEILKDIEARIAERLMESIESTHNIVTIEGVTSVIAAMGTVNDFAQATTAQTETPNTDTSTNTNPTPTQSIVPYTQGPAKKLYRNPDDVVVAGVASGLAVYFGIDPLIIRVLFVILTFVTSGAMILIYIIFALIIPKAETPAEKIQMTGGPMTLNSFRDTVNKNTQDLVGKDAPIRNWLNKIFNVFGIIVRGGVKILIGVIGIGLVIGSIIALIGFTFAFINLILNITPHVDFPIIQVISGPAYYSLVTLGYILVFVPLIVIAAIGLSLIRRKIFFNRQSVLGLGALWVIALLFAGTLSIRYVPEAAAKLRALPQYQTISQTDTNLAGFNKLEVHGIHSVILKQDTTYSITQNGRKVDIDQVQFDVRDNTLIVNHKPSERICFICSGNDRVEITIAMPDISSIETHGSVSLKAQDITTESLSLSTHGVSTVDIEVIAPTVVVEQSAASQVTLSGTSPVLRVTTSGVSRFNGKDFKTRVGTVEASENSYIIINASDSLDAIAAGVSEVIYYGTPKVDGNESENAHIQSIRED